MDEIKDDLFRYSVSKQTADFNHLLILYQSQQRKEVVYILFHV